MKVLKFAPNLVSLILNGTKTATWRLWDDKDLKTDDILEFVTFETGHIFAKAKIKKVIEKPFKELTEQDKEGHEKYLNDQELFEKFGGYYKKPVDKNTIFKVISFELLN